MKNERYLLNIYVSDNEYRKNIQVPFRQDGRICATDGHVMIRIAEGLCEEEYTDTPNGLKGPNTASVMPEPNMCETITAKVLERAMEKAPEEKDRKCQECGGTGEVNDYTAIKYQFTLHGNALCYYHLKVLLRTMQYLNVDGLRLRHMQKGEDDSLALLFDLEDKDIEILVMPQFRDEKLKEIKIKI